MINVVGVVREMLNNSVTPGPAVIIELLKNYEALEADREYHQQRAQDFTERYVREQAQRAKAEAELRLALERVRELEAIVASLKADFTEMEAREATLRKTLDRVGTGQVFLSEGKA